MSTSIIKVQVTPEQFAEMLKKINDPSNTEKKLLRVLAIGNPRFNPGEHLEIKTGSSNSILLQPKDTLSGSEVIVRLKPYNKLSIHLVKGYVTVREANGMSTGMFFIDNDGMPFDFEDFLPEGIIPKPELAEAEAGAAPIFTCIDSDLPLDKVTQRELGKLVGKVSRALIGAGHYPDSTGITTRQFYVSRVDLTPVYDKTTNKLSITGYITIKPKDKADEPSRFASILKNFLEEALPDTPVEFSIVPEKGTSAASYSYQFKVTTSVPVQVDIDARVKNKQALAEFGRKVILGAIGPQSATNPKVVFYLDLCEDKEYPNSFYGVFAGRTEDARLRLETYMNSHAILDRLRAPATFAKLPGTSSWMCSFRLIDSV